MPWYLNPMTLTHVARDARCVLSGGGPRIVRLTGVTPPEGVIFPTSAVCIEVDAKEGTVTRFAPEIPLPWPYAWGYRLVPSLKLPLVSAFDLQGVSFRLTLPQSVLGR
jgi:hypothetical protein